METAPPFGLTFAGSRLSIFWLAIATEEKASLTSQWAISSAAKPALSRAIGTANAGAIGKSIG